MISPFQAFKVHVHALIVTPLTRSSIKCAKRIFAPLGFEILIANQVLFSLSLRRPA